MVKITLAPHRLMGTHLVPKRGGESVVMDGPQFIRHFNLNLALAYEQRILSLLVPNAYIGLARDEDGQAKRFVVKNRPNSKDIQWILKKDPLFRSRLIEVWRVEDTVRDTEFVEQPGPKGTDDG